MMGFFQMFDKKRKSKPASGEMPAASKPRGRAGKKKNKLIVPEERRPIIMPPDKAGMSIKVRILGYVCRAAVIFAAVFGIVFFICDALKLEAQGLTVPAEFIALTILASVAVFSLMRLSKYGLIGGSVLIAGVLALVGISAGDVALFAEKVLVTAKNVALTRLYNLGYYAMSKYMTEISYTSERTQEYYFRYAVAMFAVLLSLVFVLSAIKRVHVLVPAVISTAVLGVVFTYNISRSNWGIAIVIASFSGILVMSAYDRLFSAGPEKSGSRFDTKTILFDEDARPKMPEGVLTRSAARMLRRQKRLEYRELKKKHKKEKTEITVDEELSEYFGSSVRHNKKAQGVAKKKLTREEKRAERAKKHEIKQQIARVRNYDRAVADSRTAQGGFAAFGIFALAMLMLIIPALTVKNSFTTIDVIDRRMEYYRKYVTAILMGDDPILDELGYENDKSNFEPHSTTAEKQVYTGAKLFTVETQYNTNIYMRGWIGTDYSDGAWYAASSEQLAAYRALYSTYLDPSETMFSNFYSFMNPKLVEAKDFTSKITSNLKYGFIAMQVNVSRVETGDALVYMPSFYRISEDIKLQRAGGYGLYKYGTSDKLDATFVNYFDGIYTGRKFMSELAYASVSNVTSMKNSDWYKNVSNYIAEYNEGYRQAYDEIVKYAEKKAKGKTPSIDSIVVAMFTEAPENLISSTVDEAAKTKTIRVRYEKGIADYVYDTETLEEKSRKVIEFTVFTSIDPVTGEVSETTYPFTPPDLSLAIRFRELMTAGEKRALAYAYYYQYMYTDFVYETYLGTQSSKIISDTLDSILALPASVVRSTDEDGKVTETAVAKDYSRAAERNSGDAEVYEQRHELVMAIVDYLKKNYTYTLDPTAAVDETLDGVENFLAVTKEGYCVQYASALALLLREAGIPARYVEGYVACDFSRNYNTDAVGSYVATVRDRNAHAWVEVWYDGIGWVQYEATPVYYDDMYVRYSSDGGSSTRPWDNTDSGTTEERELLDSIYSAIESDSSLLESLKSQAKLLIGSKEVLGALDKIEKVIESYRSGWQVQNEYYTLNKDGGNYDRDDFIANLKSFATSLEETATNPLYYQITRIDSLKAMNKAIWIITGIAAAAGVLAAVGLFLGLRAKRTEKKRSEVIERVIAGNFVDGERQALARTIVDWLTALLAAYGSAPKKGEFRDEYAKRLASEYADIFKNADKAGDETAESTKRAEDSGDAYFKAVFGAVAAEEFGFGMTPAELSGVAEFYKRIRADAKKRMKTFKRIVYHYIKRVI